MSTQPIHEALPRLAARLAASIAILICGLGLAVGASSRSAPRGASREPLSKLPIVARIEVPVGPGWLETGFGSVWLSKSKSGAVFRIDPETNRIAATIPVGRDPELGIGIGLGFVWIADPTDQSLTQIDPRTNEVVRVLAVNIAKDPEGSIGVGEGSVWIVTNEGGTHSGTLSRIEPASGRISVNIRVRPGSHAALVALGSVWVTSTRDGTVTRVDPLTNTVVAEIPVHAQPRFMAGGEGSLWVLCQSDGTLARIDPGSNRVIATIRLHVPGEGGDLSVGEHEVWAAAEHVPLSEVDPRSNRLIRQFVGGRLDDTMRVGFGAAWIVDEGHGEIWRVDLGRLPPE